MEEKQHLNLLTSLYKHFQQRLRDSHPIHKILVNKDTHLQNILIEENQLPDTKAQMHWCSRVGSRSDSQGDFYLHL